MALEDATHVDERTKCRAKECFGILRAQVRGPQRYPLYYFNSYATKINNEPSSRPQSTSELASGQIRGEGQGANRNQSRSRHNRPPTPGTSWDLVGWLARKKTLHEIKHILHVNPERIHSKYIANCTCQVIILFVYETPYFQLGLQKRIKEGV